MGQFEPVEVSTIKQGAFLEEMEAAFADAQTQLFAHVAKHGLTAEAVVTAKIKIKFEAKAGAKEKLPDLAHFGIASDVQVAIPKAPVRFSDTFKSQNQQGRDCLFAPTGGSTADNASQAVIQDGAGEPISK